MPQCTPAGKWVLYECATGQRMERWPIDARGLLASGDYTTDAPLGAATEQSVPVSPSLLASPPAEHSPGVPLVVTRSTDAPPAKPVTIPAGRTSRGKK